MKTAAAKAGLVAALCALGVPGSIEAQDTRVDVRQEECRCVDRDGNEIENCTCMRVPRIEIIRGPVATLMGRRAQIGVWIDDGQDEAVDRQGGALLTEVQEDGPAAEAGLASGDVVIRVDGRALTEPLPEAEDEEELDLDRSIPVQRFVRLVGSLEPGESVQFDILRDGDARTITVTPEAAGGFGVRVGDAQTLFFDDETMRLELEELRQGAEHLREGMKGLRWTEGDQPGQGVWHFRAPEAPSEPGSGRTAFTFFRGDPCFSMDQREGQGFAILAGGGNCVDGVEFMELNQELAEYFEAGEGGVLVTEVAEESALGLRAGDVVLAIGGREVRDPGHVRRILSSYEDDEDIRLRVLRRGSEIEVLGRRRDG